MSKKYTPFEIKRQLIAALVVVALLLGIIVTVVVSYTFNRSSLFKDQDFARAIAEALDVHAKDLTPEMLEQYDSLTFYVDIGFAPVGSGELDFDAIIKTSLDLGVEFAFVEQDNCYGEDPFMCLKKSYDYLKSMGLN